MGPAATAMEDISNSRSLYGSGTDGAVAMDSTMERVCWSIVMASELSMLRFACWSAGQAQGAQRASST